MAQTYSETRTICVPAFAKINLTLDVLDRRPDGYHNISSVMQTISLCDSVCVRVTHDPKIEIEISGPEAEGVPLGEDNLVWRSARIMLDERFEGAGAHIKLIKNIPSQAGLGGASTDAAATLIALNRLSTCPASKESLSQIAAKVGADVAFFLTGGTALVEGIGEQVSPIAEFGSGMHIVVVKPPCGVSTAVAYAALDAIQVRHSAQATKRWPCSGFSNDFEDVVFAMFPQIQAARRMLLDLGAEAVHLCGSGSAVFGTSIEPRALGMARRSGGGHKVSLVTCVPRSYLQWQ